MSDGPSQDLDEIKQSTQSGSLVDDTPAETDFVDDLAELFEDDSKGRGSMVVTANDPSLWMIFTALDANDKRRKEFCENIGIEYDDNRLNRSAAVKALVRIGIEHGDSQLHAEANEAKNEADSGY